MWTDAYMKTSFLQMIQKATNLQTLVIGQSELLFQKWINTE